MKVLIITGGSLGDDAAKQIQEFDPEWVIAADSGIQYALNLGITINQILGDFDSVNKDALARCEKEGIPRIVFPPEKDYTDTELALTEAIQKAGPDGSILILAAIGTRMDHSLANIFLMKKATDAGIECQIADDHNRICLLKGSVNRKIARRENADFVSLLPVFGNAEGITLRGFKYPLTDAVITSGQSLGVSNEIIGEEACIQLKKGYLLYMETRD